MTIYKLGSFIRSCSKMKIGESPTNKQMSNYSPNVRNEVLSNNKMESTGLVEQQEQQLNLNELLEKEKKEITKEDAKHIVNGINEFLQPNLTSLSFQLHEETNRLYVEVIDQTTNKVIREIPERELLDIYAKMTEFLGLFIDKKL